MTVTDLEPMPYTLHPDDQLQASLADVVTVHGLRVLQLQVGPVVLELYDRGALYALEELVQLALHRTAELWLECRRCGVRDSLVTQDREGILHPFCRAETTRPTQLHLVT